MEVSTKKISKDTTSAWFCLSNLGLAVMGTLTFTAVSMHSFFKEL